MKAIIFGINGQDGFYLKNLLQMNGISVTGVSRSKGDWLNGSVADLNLVESLIKEIQPHFIFHLAANSTTAHQALFENHETIVTGTWNILESVKKFCPTSKVFTSGSGLQSKNTGKPILESDPFDPNSTYSVSRIQSVYIARYYRNLGIKVFVGYFFNHDSPLRSDRHINQKIILFANRISKGENIKLPIGNVDIKKEFTFAGDIANAIWIFVNNNKYFEAVIGSGQAYSIRQWLSFCFNKFGLNWEDHIEPVPDYIADYDILVSNPEIIHSLGWKPEVTFEGLAEMMINHLNEGKN